MEIIEALGEILIPLGICVGLPVLIIWLVTRAATNSENKRAQILIEAIRNNKDIDLTNISEVMRRPRRSALQLLNLRLLRGCIFSLLGVALGIAMAVFASTDPESHVQNSLMILCGASLAIGISYLIVYFVTRRQTAGEEQNTAEEV